MTPDDCYPSSRPPLVSILVPSFNHGTYVESCIESVIAQRYQNIELLIIDDGSTDDSVSRIEGLVGACTSRFQRFEFRSRANEGLCATINEALDWCQGEYFAAIASDDVMYPDKTGLLLKFLQKSPGAAGVFGGCEIIDDSGRVLRQLRPDPIVYAFEDIFYGECSVLAPCQLLRTALLREVGGYPDRLDIDDWYMWLALTSRGHKLQVVPDILVQYRQHGSNVSKNALRMYEARKSIVSNYLTHPGQGFAMARISVMAAIDFSRDAKIRCARFLFESIVLSPRIVCAGIFWRALGRLFLPRPILLLLKGKRLA